jgi:hypothetical protein
MQITPKPNTNSSSTERSTRHGFGVVPSASTGGGWPTSSRTTVDQPKASMAIGRSTNHGVPMI